MSTVTHMSQFPIQTIATHSGRLLPEYEDAKLVRTRDNTIIESADIVVDVGGVYDPSRHRYDHHQREFVDTFDSDHSVRLSSAGLVYKHFGRRVIRQVLGWNSADQDEMVETIFMKVYNDLIQGYDGVDNGVPQYPVDIEPAYKDSTTISSRVAALNPWWNQPTDDYDERFLKAVALTGEEFSGKVKYLGQSWLPARKIVLEALENRKQAHPSGNIMVLDQFCPWKEYLHQLESEGSIPESELPYYVVYEDTSSQWRVQAVPIKPSSFASRKALPEPWRGIRDQELSTLAGIDGCVFVHASGFIGGCKTKDAALEMAIRSLGM
ncbi:hypothetical protein BSLG_009075 [Batrachochytrium salamandrivorans]|nr:hypothetical protein BSLG_009075 [Batrachochytrium salamandrivorans]